MTTQALSDVRGPFDVLIVGGGITGAGVARDAARRGLRVLLVEQSDLASGTSSRSSKLVHGGLRYLEQGELALVFESVAERRVLLDIAPHLVRPMPFLLPVFSDSRRGMFTINIGMWLYDGLSLFRSPKLHQSLSRKRVRAAEPDLRHDGLKGAQVYYDCATDDARLTLETVLDAVRHGATVLTHTRVERWTTENGRVTGCALKDQLSGEEAEVTATVAVNATGPWSDTVRGDGDTVSDPRMRPTKGVHIVVNASRLKLAHAVCCMHPDDGRVFFTIPWGEQTYIGTTDTDFEGDPGDVYADLSDVDYLLKATNNYFPGRNIGHEDVISTWAGVRPLVGDEEAENESAVSREHSLVCEPNGVVTIAGGKLTTYRKMAEEVVDLVVSELGERGGSIGELRAPETETDPLPGAVGWPERGGEKQIVSTVQDYSEGLINRATAKHLVAVLGMRAIDLAERVAAAPDTAAPLVQGRPEILGQVDWAVTVELARTVTDVMMRRTQLYYRDTDQGLGAVQVVASRMAELLGWTEEEAAAQAAAYSEEVERSRRWRNELTD